MKKLKADLDVIHNYSTAGLCFTVADLPGADAAAADLSAFYDCFIFRPPNRPKCQSRSISEVIVNPRRI